MVGEEQVDSETTHLKGREMDRRKEGNEKGQQSGLTVREKEKRNGEKG